MAGRQPAKSHGKGVLSRGNSKGEAQSEEKHGAFGETQKIGAIAAPPRGEEAGASRCPWGAGVVALPFWETKDHKKL